MNIVSKDTEQDCLNTVKASFGSECLYGISNEDLEFLKNALFTANANPESSKFPDFIFEGGYIEHFQITSSKTTKKGAEHKKEYSNYRKNTDDKIKKLQDSFGKCIFTPINQECHFSFKQPEHTYDYLVDSMKISWKRHINSLMKYNDKISRVIFMVDYRENALVMYENIYANIKEGMRFDVRKPQNFNAYKLSRDKNMLDFLFDYKDQVEFVIYVYHDGCEIIKLEHIPELKKLLPWDFSVEPLRVFNLESVYGYQHSCE